MTAATSKRYRTICVASSAAAVLAGSLLALKVASGRVETFSASASSHLPGVLRTQPPWPRNTGDLARRLDELDLPPAGEIEHEHVFLTVFVRGRQVACLPE